MNRHISFLIPECYIDTNLVETLTGIDSCNHQKGCNQVAKIMKEKFYDRFAVGMIDADKRRPGYINEFQELGKTSHLTILRHKTRPHYMILVSPAADGFILACAADAGIDLKEFNLLPDLKDFTLQTKSVMSNKDVRFKQLFRRMQSQGEMRLLRQLLQYFLDKEYKAHEEEIIDILKTI